MKSHSCLSASDPANSAGPIDRAGLTDVPVRLIPTKCTVASARPIASPAKPGAVARPGDEEHDEHEQRREQHLEDERTDHR